MKELILNTSTDGSKVLLFGSIHGDEISGTQGILRFIRSVQSGSISILKGSVHCIWECNEQAYKNRIRYMEHNLNRCFFEGQMLDSPEGEIARKLMGIMKESDYLLDLHSTSGKSVPFIFCEEQHLDLGRNMGISRIVTGWKAISDGYVCGDTESYMNSLGKTGMTFESGNHNDHEGAENAYHSILNLLSVLGMVEKNLFRPLNDQSPEIAKIVSTYISKTGNWKFKIPNVENFSPIKTGDLIGMDGDMPVIAERDGYVILPKGYQVKVGEEVFFAGEKLR